ncbi:PEGA domain-containing protein [Hyalangium versicolor]|uniref:PEGA domain-containing protein n=1 Tax=Hyalangium versicolor TaxID=2861190 RepID=UPI001CCE2CE1|nr:PEGA domain-containing protein [Hyalangium versicolor]
MRRLGSPLSGLLTLSLMLVAPVVGAQQGGGMGLDLSGSDSSQSDTTENPESPAGGDEQPGSIGLDLSGEVSNSELLPHVALVGLDTPERAGAAVAGKWLKGLFTAARSNAQWVMNTPLKAVREKLGKEYGATLRCAQANCFADAAETVEADLLVTTRLALEDDGWTFRVWTYDRDRNRVETDSVTGRTPRDVKFQKAGADLLSQQLKRLARLRSIIVVKVNVPQAVTKLGDKTLGVGNIQRNVPPGESTLLVEADGFTTYNKPVTLKPGEKTSVEAFLQLPGPGPEGPVSEVVAEATTKKSSSAPAILKRPAFYTAIIGALAVGAGVVVGMQAKKTADDAQDTDGDGIANITRKERIDLASQANLSTALLAGGAAVAGGSVLYLVLMPTRSEAPKATVEPGTGTGSTPSTAIHLLVGGSF